MEYKELIEKVTTIKSAKERNELIISELELRGINYTKNKFQFSIYGMDLIKRYEVEMEGLTKYEKLSLLEKEHSNKLSAKIYFTLGIIAVILVSIILIISQY